MGFSLHTKVDELFVKDENIENHFKVNRLKAREIASAIKKYIHDVEIEGGNKHAAELDTQDALVDLLTKIKLSEYSSMANAFNDALLDEKNAISMLEFDNQQADFQKKIQNVDEAAKENAKNYTVISWLVAIAAVLLFAGFLFS